VRTQSDHHQLQTKPTQKTHMPAADLKVPQAIAPHHHQHCAASAEIKMVILELL
jgi:hypothetical protein